MEKQWQAEGPQVLLTLDQLKLLSKALILIEQIARTSKPLPDVHFALKTIVQVQAKIQGMIRLNRWDTSAGFDANEILILRTALQIYTAMLAMLDPSPEGEEEKGECQALMVLFAPMVTPGLTHD